MKTFTKLSSIAMMSAVIAFGAVAGYAQDPCEDTEGKTKLYNEFQENFRGDRNARKLAIKAGEQYVEKFGACEADKQYVDYFKGALPAMKDRIKKEEELEEQQKRYVRFDNSVTAKNFDEVYAAGKDILKFEPEQLDVMIVLGSIGYDESIDKNNFKYNADTLSFARQAIAAMESGKTSKTYGLFGWTYRTKENAIGEMNLSIGYITAVANNNRKGALEYLFKATKDGTDTAKNPVPYEQIGIHYIDELNKMIDEVKVLEKDQKDTDTEEEAKAKAENIKAKYALLNGVAERVIDAFGRASKLATVAAYKEQLKKNAERAYVIRFEKSTGFDSWVATAINKPFPNPLSPVQPANDPAPAGSIATIEPVVDAPAAKADAPVAKPAAKSKAAPKAKRRA